jgi:hypothetical protein
MIAERHKKRVEQDVKNARTCIFPLACLTAIFGLSFRSFESQNRLKAAMVHLRG